MTFNEPTIKNAFTEADLNETNNQLIIEGGPMGQKVIVEKMKLNKIKIGRNSRLKIDHDELAGLMQSIKETGLLQPIGVTKNGTGYEICYGNRRFLACSKLGYTHIPVIIHEKKKESDIDLKNLTENIQRRSISLTEAGRYCELLKAQELTSAEIAVRLGVSRSYVDECIRAYKDVPKEYRNDLVTKLANTPGKKKQVGGITIDKARAILNAKKSASLNEEQTKALFKAAKTNDDFQPESVLGYARALKKGNTNFIKAVKPLKQLNISILMTEEEYDKLYEKFILDGPFKSVTALALAVLKGEKAVTFKTVTAKSVRND